MCYVLPSADLDDFDEVYEAEQAELQALEDSNQAINDQNEAEERRYND